MQDGVQGGTRTGSAEGSLGRQIIGRLRRRQLPQMVDWFDPGLLAKIGVRSIISTTLGQYTDQRLMQAASDNANEAELAARYDYSGTATAADMKPDEHNAIWIDYIADLGDGFEATYAMAYLLAPDYLEVPALDKAGAPLRLKAGELLVMGGDQVYPDATKQEYQSRLIDPYEWAFSTDNPKRKLFAIPGNHDWYDGLSSFSALFCSARDRISRGLGKQIGGWRCYQHRSYFAIKLPHDWWIWGPDIQLADNLDDSQRDYFDLMSEQTKPGDKIILCLAEPSWLHKNYDNMHEISMLARKNGAKICAILAGDWHHYSRYTSGDLGVQFITCGGGGAFAHATHGLKSRLTLSWASPTGASTRKASPDDSLEFNRIEQSAVKADQTDFTEKRYEISAADPAVAPSAATSGDEVAAGRRTKAVRKEEISTSRYDCYAPHIYPSQFKSRLLCLKNLALPFRNRRFAVLVGLVYLLYAWVFATADPRQAQILQKLAVPTQQEHDFAKRETEAAKKLAEDLKKQETSLKSEPGVLPDKITAAEKAARAAEKAAKETEVQADAIEKRRTAAKSNVDRKIEREASRIQAERDKKEAVEPANTATETLTRDFLDLRAIGTSWLRLTLEEKLSPKGLFDAAVASPFFFLLLLGLWAGLVYYVELASGWLATIGKIAIGSLHFAAHLTALLVVSWLADGSAFAAQRLAGIVLSTSYLIPQIAGALAILLTSLVIGGLLGGLIMGLYWTLTSTLGNMHCGDAFGALGIKDYKHFLRIKLEPERATIYPIALDKVPGRWGWRALNKDEVPPAHNPQIVPGKPLRPRLIEPPIVITAAAVKS